MGTLNRDVEPEFARRPVSSGAESTSRRADSGRSFLRSSIIVLVLSACGVAGYFLADGLYLASQRPTSVAPGAAVPSGPVVETPNEAVADEPVPTPPTAPVATPTARTIGEWSLVCPGSNAPRADCALVQRLVDTDKRPRLVWSVTRDTDGTVRAMWQTPTDVDPKQGLVLDIGDGKPRTVPFAACAEQYCLVRGILAPAYLTTLASVGRATVALSSKTGQATSYAFALTGLADGLAWLGGR